MSEENRTNAPEEELTQEDINSLKKIRMDKLEELKAKGKNPFEITKYDVTASCAEAKAQYEKLEAELKEQAGEDEEKLKASRGKPHNSKRCRQSNVKTSYGQGKLFRSER